MASASASASVSAPAVLATLDEKRHSDELWDITRDPEVMRGVAGGKLWKKRQLANFFAYCVEEESQPDDARDNYYYAVLEDEHCVGIVGVHTATHMTGLSRVNPFLTIFLSSQSAGRGLGRRAVTEALAAYWEIHPKRPVLIDTREDNLPMICVAEALGFKRLADVRIRDVAYRRYKIANR